MALEIEETGINLGTVNTANTTGLNELTGGETTYFKYNEDIINVIKEVTKSNLYFNQDNELDESINLEVITGVLNKLSEISDSTNNVETIMSIKTLIDGGIIEFMVTSGIRKRAAVYVMMKAGIGPKLIVNYMHDIATVDESIVNLNDNDKTMVKDAINEIVKLSLDETGNPKEVVLTNNDSSGFENVNESPDTNEDATGVNASDYSDDNEEVNSNFAFSARKLFGDVFKEATDNINNATKEASGANANQKETLENLLSKPMLDFGSGSASGGTSDGISAAGAIGIGLGVVALGAAAYFGYNCFFGDGCEDDITLMD